jgi:hypothetical protein
MSGNRFNAYQDHGVGIGLRIPHYNHIFSRKPVVDWFEIISENFMCDAGRPLACSIRFWSSIAWCSMASRCTSAR